MISPGAPPETSAGTARTGVKVTVDRVTRIFAGGVLVLNGMSIEIAPGSFVALIGPSGCGKSTLLRLIAGLDRADGGTVRLSDDDEREDGDPGRAAIAYVFQDAHLLPWRNVVDNAALPLELMGVSRDERRDKARAALEQVGLGDAAGRYPAELSGGMKMRVSLARALVTRPRIMLLDEPFAALDELTRQRLDDQLRALWLELGMTVLFVTHSIAEAAYLAERCLVLSRRPARIMLDQRIDLPRARSAALRADPRFARVLGPLHEALERGNA